MILKTNGPVFTILGKMKQTANTKKTLGRAWFRYFQLYSMTDKLTTACMKIGWTHTDRENYAKEHYHLVNQFTANMVKDGAPDVPQPDDLKWLSSHPEVSGSGKVPRSEVNAGTKKRKRRKIQTRNCGPKGDKKIPKIYTAPHTANAIPKASKGNRTDLQSVLAIPEWCGFGSTGSCGGLPGRITGGL